MYISMYLDPYLDGRLTLSGDVEVDELPNGTNPCMLPFSNPS